MTDMRATERLLEVIEERCEEFERGWRDSYTVDVESFRALVEFVVGVKHEIRELRRRGDTLVRAEDLRLVLEGAKHLNRVERSLGHAAEIEKGPLPSAIDRLENALGGKLA